jgi:two-component system, OmpR family, phosphate regulon response regulator OmpR
MSGDPAHILVVDDDQRLRDLLQQFLAGAGFRVTTADSAADARVRMAMLTFDLIVLDLMMPGESGLDFAKALRAKQNGGGVPILMLTAMGEAEDRIRGLEMGADDYLAKPFEPRELVLRIGSILRRVPRADELVPLNARLGDSVFDLGREELTRQGQMVPLTAAERRLLRTLAERPGAVFSREELAKMVAPGGGERTVDVQVTRLRRKIEPDPKVPRYLQTVRGQGYLLRPD